MPSHLRIDLNADLGESEDTKGDEALLEVVSSISLACGVHAGSARTIGRLSSIAQERGVGVGAHPGLEAGPPPAPRAAPEARGGPPGPAPARSPAPRLSPPSRR